MAMVENPVPLILPRNNLKSNAAYHNSNSNVTSIESLVCNMAYLNHHANCETELSEVNSLELTALSIRG